MMLEQHYSLDDRGNYIAPGIAANSFTAGLHAGCAYRLAERWSLHGELGADGLWLKAFSLQDAIVTAGVQYRIP